MDIYEDCFFEVLAGLESIQEVLDIYISTGSDKGGVNIANAIRVMVNTLKAEMSEAQEKARKAG